MSIENWTAQIWVSNLVPVTDESGATKTAIQCGIGVFRPNGEYYAGGSTNWDWQYTADSKMPDTADHMSALIGNLDSAFTGSAPSSVVVLDQNIPEPDGWNVRWSRGFKFDRPELMSIWTQLASAIQREVQGAIVEAGVRMDSEKFS